MSGGKTLYLPLPQSNSDDSEEELHSGRENHIVNRPRTKTGFEVHLEAGNVGYNELDNRDHDVNIGGYVPSLTIIKSSSTFSRLCSKRKLFFILSISICMVTLAVFLWALPCDLDQCPAAVSTSAPKSWEAPLIDMELHGPISVVPSPNGRGKNIILLARNVSAPGPRCHSIVCLLGFSGSIAWTHVLSREPWDVDCSILDANKDGVLDCVIAGKQDLLKVIDPLSGIPIWELNPTSSSPAVSRTLFPILVPDITVDGTKDLLTARMFADSALPCQLILVSGSTGQVIGVPVQTIFCAGISGLVLDKDLSISYTCLNSNNENSERTVSLLDLLKSSGRKVPSPWPPKHLGDLPRTSEMLSGATHEARVGGWRLLVENAGKCSSECWVTVVVKDKNNNTVRNFSLQGTYAMTPVTLSFDKLSGFVLKFWQWNERKGKRTSNAPTTTSASTVAYREMKKRASEQWVEVIERVVLITFNDTDFHVVNVSQKSIVIFCQTPSSCLPSPRSLQRSLLISDLDGDSSKELISFSTNYIGKLTQLRLQSRVRVVRLEEELPQLFETSPVS